MFILCTRTHRRGSALLLAIVALGVLTALGLAMSATSMSELNKATTHRDITAAQFCAEDGMTFIATEAIPTMRLPSTVTAEDLLSKFVEAITKTDATGAYTNNLARNLQAQYGQVSLTPSNGVLTVPPLTIANGTCSLRFTSGTDTDGTALLNMYVTGNVEGTERTVALTFRAEPYISPVFDYGIASKGRVRIKGNATITGVPADAGSILSTADTFDAVEVGGHASISGDLHVTTENSLAVNVYGSATVAGETNASTILNDHTHYGVEDPEFPQVDTSAFATMYQNDITSQADIDNQPSVTADFDGDGNDETRQVFENIRIVANASASNNALDFRNNAIINGVVYVEYPNWIVFHSTVTINGVIVSDNTHIDGQSLGSVEFRGQSSIPGVEALPDDPKWDAIKDAAAGTSILIPGFDLSFRGATFAMNGMIAAEVISFRGNADINGDLPGPILGLGDYAIVVGEEVVENDDMTTVIQGNINITLTARDETDIPGGLVGYSWLQPVPETYTDLVPTWR